MAITIDISPNQQPNFVVLSIPYTIYVAVLGTADFDPSTLEPGVTFGPTGNEASPIMGPMTMDINFDGSPDSLYFFSTPQSNFQLGDTTGILRGVSGGVDVTGTDSVQVLP